ncbi:MAG: ubiquinone/menaquinone biosynthesis C-methylase UbiE [Gammaproteobacteria bacterium]|jgi:ubiquinone/menaquinone biosynthesis C-methylase UbiE
MQSHLKCLGDFNMNEHQEHNKYQQRYFSDNIDVFREEIPGDVKQRTEAIVAAAQLTPRDRVLDVGTGLGVLIPYFQGYHVNEIVGCDLNSSMLAEARQKYPALRFWHGDFIDLPQSLGLFDAVFFNAMFGNVWDQRAALIKAATLLKKGGRIIISHPMGASFAEELHQQDSKMVLHPLPGRAQLDEMIRCLTLKVQLFRDDYDLYIVVLRLLDIQSQR